MAIRKARPDVDSGVGASDLHDVHAGVDERLVGELEEKPQLRVCLLRLDARHLEEEVVEKVLVAQQPLPVRQVPAKTLLPVLVVLGDHVHPSHQVLPEGLGGRRLLRIEVSLVKSAGEFGIRAGIQSMET